ncbi:MAG: hypothetical protein QXT49_08140 [Candidatus Nezhaarchaeales archaeon]
MAGKGIHSGVVAVLLIIIAVSLTGMVWLFSSTTAQSLTKGTRVDIMDAKYLLGTTNVAMVTVEAS